MIDAPVRSQSIFIRRLSKFRRLKRGYYSFLIIVVAYGVSFFLPLLANNLPLAVRYQGQWSFPILRYHPPSDFGVEAIGEPDYRALRVQFRDAGRGDFVLMPIY